MTLDNYERHPKNPHMANFFVQIGRAEHLGTCIRNIYKYVPLYTDKQPVIDDENVYTVKMALPTLMNAENSVRQEGVTETTQKTREKTREKIVEAIKNNPTITSKELATLTEFMAKGIEWHLKKLQSQGIIRRVGPDKGGHWEIIE